MTSQKLMRRFLSGVCELETATELKVGSALVREKTYDLLILDFLFPDGDSMPLLHQARGAAATKTTPIIVVSSSMDELLVDRVLKAGANDALRKPFEAYRIRALVERMLTAPYMRPSQTSMVSVNCFQWATKDAVYQYCHELDLTLSAPSEAEVSRLMAAALQERVTRGAALGFAYQEIVVTHTLRQ